MSLKSYISEEATKTASSVVRTFLTYRAYQTDNSIFTVGKVKSKTGTKTTVELADGTIKTGTMGFQDRQINATIDLISERVF